MVSNLGNSLPIVSGVYVAVLIPWTLLYTLDFISSKWVTIRNTQVKGCLHLVIIAIPISYIVAYIVFQTQLPEPDYKEMYAAVAALVLSGYHLARTVWGLRQLIYLKSWMRHAATAIRDAGYHLQKEPAFKPTNTTSATNEPYSLRALITWLSKLSVVHTPIFGQRRALRDVPKPSISIDEVVAQIQVNNSLIDNEFNAGIADHVQLVSWRRLYALPLKPSKPKVTFTRWAVAFIAQFGTAWLKDAFVREQHADPWIDKRRNFALQMLTTAILQTDPTESHSYLYDRVHSVPVGKEGKSFLPPDAWEQISHSRDAWHVFSPRGILASFFSHNEGLPYQCPVVEHRKQLPPRSLLKPIIKEAINGLKPRMQERLENFRSEHLELFAIFLWVQNTSRNLEETSDKTKCREGENFTASKASYEFLQRQLGLDEDERALEQLGYPFSKHARSRHLWYNRNVLEVSCRIDNWLALSSAEQLCSLEDVIGMSKVEYDPSTEKSEELGASNPSASVVSGERRNSIQRTPTQCLEQDSAFPEIQNRAAQASADSADKPREKEESYYRQSKILETKRLRFQLANDETRYDHSEQSLSFMGCVMESLRSGLAYQLYTGLISEREDKEKRRSSWIVPIPADFLEFPISQELWKCLRKRKCKGDLHSAVQERLLWECQVGTHHCFQTDLSEPDVHEKVSSMILFILGFPSVFIRPNAGYDRFGTTHLRYTIHAARPPQTFHILVEIERYKGNPLVKLRLLKEDNLETDDKFHWRLWRDAFLGRIKAKAKWQKSHGMTQVHVNTRTGNGLFKPISYISQGGKKRGARTDSGLMHWEGWPPFREGLAIFEQQCLLVDRGKEGTPQRARTSPSEKSSVLQDKKDKMQMGRRIYADCLPAILSNTMSDIDTALELGGPSVIWGRLKKKEQSKAGVPRRNEGGSGEQGWSGPWGAILSTIRLTPLNMSSSVRPNVQEKIPDNEETFREAQKLNPTAMFKVAQWVLKGEGMYRQNREQALVIMENALQVEKKLSSAWLYVKTCLEGASLYEAKRDENLDRAFSVVKMFWTDVEIRLRKGTAEERGETVKLQKDRVSQITDMNATLVREKRTSATLQDFADRLTMWFCVTEDNSIRDRAITLYESAVIADGDGFAMLKLALLNATKDEEDMMRMAQKFCKSVEEKLEEKLKDSSPGDGIKGNRFDFAHTSIEPYILRNVKEYIRLEKARHHPGALRLAERMGIEGEPKERSVRTSNLDVIAPMEDVRSEGNILCEQSQDHTIVHIPEVGRLRETDEMPLFPHASYL
eukprot:TRINITY_DN286_c0_g1_i1.p1 TRINITY_DN286_c0_g1~~TRINITY_DN286_c0_g1_i1.p1  ORF type:complete len:1287 (-),score=185.75 TRINITY_DN286_c0_g1_i1:9033-12893(-)